MTKMYSVFSILILILSCNDPFGNNGGQISNEKDMLIYGQKIYQTQCIICHGAKGNSRIAQASDLTVSKLDETQIGDLVYHGGKNMPRFNDKLGEPEINAVAKYVLTLRESK